MRLATIFSAAITGFIVTIPSQAHALELISNGTFDTDFTSWSPFTTVEDISAGTSPGTSVNDIFTFNTNGGASPANDSPSARFQVGRTSGSNPGGGGIFQTITTTGGNLAFFANIAVDSTVTNASGGVVTLSFDGNVVDTFDFQNIQSNVEEFATLTGNVNNVAAGSYEVRFLITRTLAPNFIRQFIDNVSVFESAVPVPFEFSPAWGLSICGGLYLGKRFLKSAKSK